MEFVLLMAGSITHAQRMAAVLENRGIRGHIIRAPEGTDQRGCGYGVRVRRGSLSRCLEILRYAGFPLRGVYEPIGNGWQEVAL